MCKSNKDKGFTFIEMLFVLLLITILFLLMTKLFVLLLSPLNDEKMNEFEWQLFLLQLKMEFREADAVSITANTLMLTAEDGKVISYEMYNDRIRRRVDRSGHEIVLQKISNVNYHFVNNGIVIEVVDKEDVIYYARLSAIHPLKVINND